MNIGLLHTDPNKDFTVGTLATHPKPIVFYNMNSLTNSMLFFPVVVSGDKHKDGNIEFKLYGPHCKEATDGQKFDERFDMTHIDLVMYKGQDINVACHSAFADSNGKPTGLGGYLDAHKLDVLVITGYVTDICVKATAIDALCFADRVVLAIDACQPLSEENAKAAIKEMEALGIEIMTTADILKEFGND